MPSTHVTTLAHSKNVVNDKIFPIRCKSGSVYSRGTHRSSFLMSDLAYAYFGDVAYGVADKT